MWAKNGGTDRALEIGVTVQPTIFVGWMFVKEAQRFRIIYRYPILYFVIFLYSNLVRMLVPPLILPAQEEISTLIGNNLLDTKKKATGKNTLGGLPSKKVWGLANLIVLAVITAYILLFQ